MDGNALFDEYMRQRQMSGYPKQMQVMPSYPSRYGGQTMLPMPYRMGTAPRGMQPMPYQMDPSNPMYRALMQRFRSQR